MQQTKFCKKCQTEYPLTPDFWYGLHDESRPPYCKTCRLMRYQQNKKKELRRNREAYYRRKHKNVKVIPAWLSDILDIKDLDDSRMTVAMRLVAQEFKEAQQRGEQAIEDWVNNLLDKKDLSARNLD